MDLLIKIKTHIWKSILIFRICNIIRILCLVLHGISYEISIHPSLRTVISPSS